MGGMTPAQRATRAAEAAAIAAQRQAEIAQCEMTYSPTAENIEALKQATHYLLGKNDAYRQALTREMAETD